MATCPHCGEFLDVQHECHTAWRLRLRVWAIVALGALAGATAFALVSLGLYGMTVGLTIAAGALLGGVVAHAYLRGEP